MNFFIKQNSTLPELKFPLTQDIREKFDITDEMMENVAITFSMRDAESGVYKIANVPAKLIQIEELDYKDLDESIYTLAYRFKLRDTKKSGRYLGEFCVDFLGSHCGKIKFPVHDQITVIIKDSITKTTVI